jgi:hypothetical protein
MRQAKQLPYSALVFIISGVKYLPKMKKKQLMRIQNLISA